MCLLICIFPHLRVLTIIIYVARTHVRAHTLKQQVADTWSLHQSIKIINFLTTHILYQETITNLIILDVTFERPTMMFKVHKFKTPFSRFQSYIQLIIMTLSKIEQICWQVVVIPLSCMLLVLLKRESLRISFWKHAKHFPYNYRLLRKCMMWEWVTRQKMLNNISVRNKTSCSLFLLLNIPPTFYFLSLFKQFTQHSNIVPTFFQFYIITTNYTVELFTLRILCSSKMMYLYKRTTQLNNLLRVSLIILIPYLHYTHTCILSHP